MKARSTDKTALIKHIISRLTSTHQQAVSAAQQAYNTATDDENIAENKYDTLGLEASYLAQGQSKRVKEIEADLETYSRLQARSFASDEPISVGALINLIDDENNEKTLFIGPTAGGLTLNLAGQEITLITPSAPLAQLLMGKHTGDEVELSIGSTHHCYEITMLA